MALYQYSRGALFYEGTIRAEWTEGTVSLPGSFRPVVTMAEGGSRRGFVRDEAKGMELSFTAEIRQDGTEFEDLLEDWMNGSIVTVGVWIGGKSIMARGVLNIDDIVLHEGKISATFLGAKPDIR